MAMNMREKIARAIVAADAVAVEEEIEPTSQTWAMLLADAALSALETATPEMVNAAVDATGAGSDMSWSNRSPQSLFQQGWCAMIRKAKEG